MDPLQQLLLRSLSFVYAVAFLVAVHQNQGLLGDDGLMPVNVHLTRRAAAHNTTRQRMFASPLAFSASEWNAFRETPSLLWFTEPANVDSAMHTIGAIGLTLAIVTLMSGRANSIAMLALWACYFSIVSVGQSFYSFGWESQLLETGFVGVLLVPLVSFRYPHKVPLVVTVCYRWLLFRVMFGAGMIKLRGDPCWRDLTCMEYHYQTQPIPNPLSVWFHGNSKAFHAFEVWVNHFVEIVAPFFVMLPQPSAAIGGLIQIGFMSIIIVTGNLSFLNWLTIVPAFACLSSDQLRWVARLVWRKRDERSVPSPAAPPISHPITMVVKATIHFAYFIAVVFLSIPVVENLFGAQQVMNTSYDWLRLVNTYGNFGSITKVRNEVIVEGQSAVDPSVWREFEFACKPGNVSRRPCTVSPYHYRLDWLMWFAAFGSINHNPWLVHLAHKILRAHTDSAARDTITSLGVVDPFLLENMTSGHPVRIRMWLVQYKYRSPTMSLGEIAQMLLDTGFSSRDLKRPLWRRGSRKEYLPPVSVEQLQPYVDEVFPKERMRREPR